MRLDELDRLAALYPEMGNTLKRNFAGWRAYFLTGDPALAKLIRLSASKRSVLFNGALGMPAVRIQGGCRQQSQTGRRRNPIGDPLNHSPRDRAGYAPPIDGIASLRQTFSLEKQRKIKQLRALKQFGAPLRCRQYRQRQQSQSTTTSATAAACSQPRRYIMQRTIWIMWPSFLIAGAMTVVFFTLVDPADLTIFGVALAEHRFASYSVGFLLFWLFSAWDSWLTLFFQRDADTVNHPQRHHDNAIALMPGNGAPLAPFSFAPSS